MKNVKMIVQWVLVAFLLICSLAWSPSFTSVLFILAAVILLPIKQLEEFFEKIKLKFSVRIVMAIILFVLAFAVSPDKAPATARKEAREQSASSSDEKDDSKDESKESKKDDSKNESKDSKKDDSKDESKDSKKNDSKDDKKDSKNNDSKDDNNDSSKDDIAGQIIDVWHYGGRAIDFYYTFYEDGTWALSSDGGAYDKGTYEIVDGKKIKMKGEFDDHTFKIKNADTLEDEDGESLTRFRHSDF